MLIKPEQSSARPAMVTARKLLEANSSRMAHLDWSCVPALNRTTVTLHSQKDFARCRKSKP